MKRCELLIPAGGKKQFIAAVENGADAVYVGGRDFNARINAENFSVEELEKAVDYGHLKGVKTYVTMNTLLDDEQLEPALLKAAQYYNIGVDGIIIQDMGLGLLIKENVPKLPIHLSTQAGTYDAEGVEAAASLGYERVVLARELSLEEIKRAVKTGIEIEVFIHGALCMCYSGQCQLSRYIGGRSGNKGACAQPCRLPYTGMNNHNYQQTYPLSPKDLCLIEDIGALAEAGIASLKVEGRMKSPEYVAIVTSIYRKYIDLWYEKGGYQVESQDLDALKQIFNRGGFTKGYLYGDPGHKLMSPQVSKNTGIYVGKTQGDSKGPLIKIKAEGDISKGDYIEIRGKETVSALVTYKKNVGNGSLEIGDVKSKIQKGSSVYRLVSGNLMEKARKTFENVDYDTGRHSRKMPIYMKLTIISGKPMELEASCRINAGGADTVITVKKYGAAAEEARNGTGCREMAKRQLSKTGGTPFVPQETEVVENQPCHVPVSLLNDLRRETLKELEEKIKACYKNECSFGHTSLAEEHEALSTDEFSKHTDEPLLELLFYNIGGFTNCDMKELSKLLIENGKLSIGSKVRAMVPIHQFTEALQKEMPQDKLNVEISPYIQGINKGSADRWIEENFESIVQVIRDNGNNIYVGNIRWIKPFADAGINVIGDSGLNITNCYSKKAYRMLGVSQFRDSLEKQQKGTGAFPLMIMEHKFDDAIITDRKGQEYRLAFDDFSHKTLLIKENESIEWDLVRRIVAEGKTPLRLYITTHGQEYSMS